MREQIRNLIAESNTEEALKMLASVNKNAILLQAQFNSGKKNFNMGLVEHSEWLRIQAKINFTALELVDELPNKIQQSNSKSETMNFNPLKEAKRIFEKVQEDLDTHDYVLNNLKAYCNILDQCLNSNTCIAFVDFATKANWNDKSNAEKKQDVKEALESLMSKKDKILAKLSQHVETKNNEEPLHETLRLFQETPNGKNWDKLFIALTKRFSDTTLFSTDVAKTWAGWKDKLANLKDDFDWSLSFKDTTLEQDLWNFIRINSQIKNFNY